MAEKEPEGPELFCPSAQGIDLISTRYDLSGMERCTLLRNVRSIRPDVRMVLASGFLEPEQCTALTALGVHGIIQKPYGFDELLSVLRTVLDGGRSTDN